MKSKIQILTKSKILLTFSFSPFDKLRATLLTKLLFLLFTFHFSLLTIRAQTNLPELKFDSLVRANENYNAKDLKKLKLLNLLAKGYCQINPAKGIETADEAILLARRLNTGNDIFWLEQAAALYYKGKNLSLKGEYDQALILYEQALAINEKHKNSYGKSVNLSAIGDIYRLRSDFTKALEYFSKSRAISEQENYELLTGATLSVIGDIYYRLSDYSKAMEYQKKALRIYEKSGRKENEAGVLVNIGNIHLSSEENSEALAFYTKALTIYEKYGNKLGMAKVTGNMGVVYQNISDYPKSITWFTRSLELSEQLGNRFSAANSLSNIANTYMYQGNYTQAIEYQKKALAHFEYLGNKRAIAGTLDDIATVYYYLQDYTKSLELSEQALAINEKSGNKEGQCINLTHIGNSYFIQSNYEKALDYYNRALSVNEQLNNKKTEAQIFGAIAKVYTDMNDTMCYKLGFEPKEKFTKAIELLKKSILVNEQYGDKGWTASNYYDLAHTYFKMADYGMALAHLDKSLKLAEEIGELPQQRDAWEGLSEVYEKKGDYAKAYEAHLKYIEIKDTINASDIKGKIQQMEMQDEFEKKEAALKYEKRLSDEKVLRQQKELGMRQQALVISNKEKDLQRLAYLKDKAELEKQKTEKEKQLALSEKERELLGKEKELQAAELAASNQQLATKQAQRNLFIAATVLMLLLAGSIFLGLKRTAKEKKKSDNLLHNILPQEVAYELKTKGASIARQFKNVTVLFTDFANFTGISEKMQPEELVTEIDYCFKAFDEIIERNGLEKIKTIGDAYMAACGLPKEDKDHAQKTIKAALEICAWMKQHKAKGGKFDLRAGLSSGSVVAGIVGNKKFAYDIWGDTVNTASRMESSGEVGKVNISQSTYELVKNRFTCEFRGEMEAKGKGKVKMYFVSTKS